MKVKDRSRPACQAEREKERGSIVELIQLSNNNIRKNGPNEILHNPIIQSGRMNIRTLLPQDQKKKKKNRNELI